MVHAEADGYESTACLNRNGLIMRANASSHDIEKSIAASCNAHLSKPISRLELLSAIAKYRRRSEPGEMAQSARLESIRIEMPPDTEEIVPGYLANRRKEIPEMRDCLAGFDFARLATLGHNLKGTGVGYGFPDLARLGAELELSAIQRDWGSLQAQVTEVDNYLDRVQLVRVQSGEQHE